ncbi:uncharacterized protein LTR77_002458 [Saxophila tyrrhenica]|uniref:Uncharacterized protein n=1 Tax=Saxophila tyrrhenica TaxID=1690608 RepID=A0AAV9PIX8_9PEZI|nr:hypothetical protein LTR77_002458 [Saxophila tyrrhenica]
MPRHAENPLRDESFYPGRRSVDFDSPSSRRRSSRYDPSDSSSRLQRDSNASRYNDLDSGYTRSKFRDTDGFTKSRRTPHRDIGSARHEEEQPRAREPTKSRRRERADSVFAERRERARSPPPVSSRRAAVGSLFDGDFSTQRQYYNPRSRSPAYESRQSERRESRYRGSDAPSPEPRRASTFRRSDAPSPEPRRASTFRRSDAPSPERRRVSTFRRSDVPSPERRRSVFGGRRRSSIGRGFDYLI